MVKKVTPYFMFDSVAKEAMALYVSIFPDSQILESEEYGTGEQGAEGSIKTATFTVGGQTLSCIDSPFKHDFTFTPSISILVECETESELHEAYKVLSEGGEVLMPLDNYGFSKQFGWINDYFGVSWQLNLS